MGNALDKRAAENLQKLLSLPISSAESGLDGFDPWDVFRGIVGSYNSEIDVLAISAIERMSRREFFAETPFDEMFAYILCGHHMCEYGTSPRGCWPTLECEPLFPKWAQKWREWYREEWGEECP